MAAACINPKKKGGGTATALPCSRLTLESPGSTGAQRLGL